MSGTSARSTREIVNLHTDIFDFLCTFHRVKRLPSKDTNPGALANDEKLSDEQRGELINRYLYKILNEIELRISSLKIMSEPVTTDFYEEWSFLTWTLLSILNRLQSDTVESKSFLDYRGKHFKEKINSALVELVNKAQRMQPPEGVPQNEPAFERFYQAYVSTLISLHHLMNRQQINSTNQANGHGQYYAQEQKWMKTAEFEAQIELLKEQMSACFRFQREFCNSHNFLLWQRIRESQLRRMTEYEYENKEFMESSISFYSNMLYNLGVLAARLQGFHHEIRSNHAFAEESESDVVKPLLHMVYGMVEALLCDSIICIEPSQNAILVTNNLFPMKIVSLCRCVFFRNFSLQIVSEEVAQQIQQEMRQRKVFEPLASSSSSSLSSLSKSLTWPPASAALLAMKPSSGVKRNNATASAEGGNTAHKKSDVNSKEWISIPPLFDAEYQCWIATYPHLLCTTRQKDTLLDTRSASQTGKRPLFYFHVKAEMFSFSGRFSAAHTLSLPFTIATRRNQDCQVQRMMSSYTATCFWLYGTKIIDGLLIQWYDNEIEWKHFKILYAQHFSLNAEVRRTLMDEDFNILQYKMHCSECTDSDYNQTTQREDYSQSGDSNKHAATAASLRNSVTFKNVLCPHLHYIAGKMDLRFSIWRGMLELQHLFSDQRTDVKNLWENGILQGFMEDEKVHSHLQAVESGLVMRLSFVMGCCVCFSVKSGSQVIHLEPLDIRRLQSKSVHEYLRDILTAEKVKYVLNMHEKWIHVNEVIKVCQRIGTLDSYNATSKEVKSNAMSAGGVELEHTLRFTPMRVAVVTCKQPITDEGKLDVSSTTFQSPSSLTQQENDIKQMTSAESNSEMRNTNEFIDKLESLMLIYGKTAADISGYLNSRQNSMRISYMNADEPALAKRSAATQISNESCIPQHQQLEPIISLMSSKSIAATSLLSSSVSCSSSPSSYSVNTSAATYGHQRLNEQQRNSCRSCCYSQPSTSQSNLQQHYSAPTMYLPPMISTSTLPIIVSQQQHHHQQQSALHYNPNFHAMHHAIVPIKDGKHEQNMTSYISSLNYNRQEDNAVYGKQREMMLSDEHHWATNDEQHHHQQHQEAQRKADALFSEMLSTPLNTPSAMNPHSDF